ncbi:MAG: regulator [Phycisphaerae bacterium]|nr:regulator [Phycisphaerae bacterium]
MVVGFSLNRNRRLSPSVHPASSAAAKQVFTTGEAAKICNLSQQTIIRCFDAGRLRGYKVPGSKARRIPRDELVQFMRSHHMPLDILGENDTVLLVIDRDSKTVDDVRRVVDEMGGYVVHSATTAYEAGVQTARLEPEVLVINPGVSNLDIAMVCQTLRNDRDQTDATVILLDESFSADMMHKGSELGITHFLQKPLKKDELITALMPTVNA